MYRARIARQGLRWPRDPLRSSRRCYVTDTEVDKARQYCVAQLRQSDYDSYLIRNLLPKSRQDAYDALRAFNLELVRLPELVSNPMIGQMRMQFWRDAVNNTFAGKPPKEPIMILLYKVIEKLAETGGTPSSIKFWLLRLINTREKHMDNRPFASIASLEEYAENTYSTLMYSNLAALPMQSMHMDHLASHIGKACGIVAVLRGIPFLAASSPPVASPSGSRVVGSGRNPVLLLPLDVMAETGLKEEDVYRQGPRADGFEDAVFKVATRANDHLITAREMLKNLRAGQSPGHEYEHHGEEQHEYPLMTPGDDDTKRDLRRGFSALLEGIPASDYLTRLEAQNFNPFTVKSSWKLPWRLWRAVKSQQI
ncbi:Squalene/phytoene synthase [Hypoxylon rubiginosum]|uniref:Squalene/phytoene synthase n=1 Tax=Hypoxylon rubiginosum TaxID=110542 RepID=A0ACB9YRU1_9PEZI|nr:Squalene/phytoene synthase [Hypoxylon rubiginosum]